MKLKEIKASEKAFLTPNDVSEVLQCKPYSINVALKAGQKMPFPCFLLGSRVKIPRLPFVAYAEENGLE